MIETERVSESQVPLMVSGENVLRWTRGKKASINSFSELPILVSAWQFLNGEKLIVKRRNIVYHLNR